MLSKWSSVGQKHILTSFKCDANPLMQSTLNASSMGLLVKRVGYKHTKKPRNVNLTDS